MNYPELLAMSKNKDLSLPQGRAELTAQILRLEERILQENQVVGTVKHYFSHDVYARELDLPAGTLVVGAIHKYRNLNIISKGHVTFFSTDGAITVEAPYTFVASPGVKRVIFAHQDTIWTTIHGTPEIDLHKIEDIFIAKNYDDVEGISLEEKELIKEARKCLGL